MRHLDGLHADVCYFFVDAVLLEGKGLSEEFLGCFVFECIVFEEMDVEDLLFFAHDTHGLIVGDLPLVDLPGDTLQVWLVCLLN